MTATKTKTSAQDVQDEILQTARQGQDAVVDAVKAWADAVKAIIPPLPATSELAAKLPKPEELVANAYDFAEQLLATQRQYAEKLLAAAAPVLPTTK
jgi:hypothetical protein